MINKGMVVFLASRGWSQASIARRFKRSPTRIFQIIGQIKRLGGKLEEIRCEICNKSLKKKQFVKVEGTKPFLVCNDCKRTLQEKGLNKS